MAASGRRIGILAGGGSLPKEIADSLAARGVAVKIVAIDGEADADFAGHDVARVNWGQIGKLVDEFRSAGVGELLIIGKVRRPDLWSITPDWGLIRYLPAILRLIASGGDDSVLRHVVRFFEGRGFRVVGPAEVAPQLLIGAGAFASQTPSAAEISDIERGLAAVRILGVHDVGQAVVVAGGRVEAVEGAEGTDAMLERLALLRRSGGEAARARHGVLVKRSKPAQELRIDLPAIGPETVTRAVECGLAGIAVEAGRVVAARRADLKARADAAGLFIVGVSDAAAPPGTGRAQLAPPRIAALGEIAPGKREISDASKGALVLSDVSQILVSRAAVVSRGYVLGVEAGEGIDALLSRVAGLRQWGEARLKRRIGIAVLADASELSLSIVAAASGAGLAGIAIADRGGGLEPRGDIAGAIQAAGLCLLAVHGLSGDKRHEAASDRADKDK